jgi:catalase
LIVAQRVAIGMLVALSQLASVAALAQENPTLSEQTVNALEGAYGVHPGERRNHAKGLCALGTFVGTSAAAAYSRSALFSGAAIPVVARFSLAGGNPEASDAERSPRGMALEFRLPNGGLQHMTMIDTPMFFAAIPRTFLDKMLALEPDPTTGKPDPQLLAQFAETHPDSRSQTKYLAEHNPPASYANSAYFGIHTFKFVAKDDAVTLVKWRFVPQDGEKPLGDAELSSKPRDFLEQALIQRAKAGPVRWDMILTIGRPGDAEDDPTILWPKDRKEVKAGTLTITSALDQEGGGCEEINYDPLVMGDGIAPTRDPVLLFRSSTYGISASRRLQGQ